MASPLNDRINRENPMHYGDAIEFQPDGTTKGLDINGGILQNYRKVTERSVNDILEDDWWKKMQGMKHEVANYFNNVSQNEQDMMNSTKNLVMRKRLNREISFNDDFRRKYIVNEYGNYEKYQKNSISVEREEGEDFSSSFDKAYGNYLDFVKRLPTVEGEQMREKDREDIRELLTSQEKAHQEFNENFFEWKTQEKTAVTN